MDNKVTPNTPPNNPSQVLLGLISLASFMRPKDLPIKYAPISITQTMLKKTSRNMADFSYIQLIAIYPCIKTTTATNHSKLYGMFNG